MSVTASSTAVLDVFTTEATTLVNGVGAGAALDVLDVIPNVLSVAVTSAFAGEPTRGRHRLRGTGTQPPGRV